MTFRFVWGNKKTRRLWWADFSLNFVETHFQDIDDMSGSWKLLDVWALK